MNENFLNIPMEMRTLEQWVNIDADSKCPLNPMNGSAASSSDPGTWASFEEAVHRVECGDTDNIGFVFDDNGIIGIDIDDGFDEDGLLSPTAVDILGKCHSYTERSRSGRGFHVILKGTLPFSGKNNKKGVEIYRDGRYFITTGDTLLFRKVIENQAAIDYVVETYFQDDIKEGDGKPGGTRIYSPVWELPDENGRIKLRPKYPRITPGSRNISMASLAGILHSAGYPPEKVYEELHYANAVACDPVLDDYEIESITRSITRYKR